ncbi:MAG: hypothetical protein V8Q43_00310 [Christensenellaceae bacterium]
MRNADVVLQPREEQRGDRPVGQPLLHRGIPAGQESVSAIVFSLSTGAAT